MIRPLTLICVVLFLFSGFYDYQTTHQVDLKDQQIAATRAAVMAARNDSKILQTEWSWLNRPDRLQPFAAQFLSLQEVAPSQYVPLAQLAQHLPAPGSIPAIAPNVEFAAAAPVAAPVAAPSAAPIVAPVKLAAALPATKPASEPQLAEQAPVKTPAKAPATQLASIEQQLSQDDDAAPAAYHAAPKPGTVAKAVPAPRPVMVASALPSRPLPAPLPAPVAHSVARSVARPVERPVERPVMVAENDPPRPTAVMPARSSSSLGMAQGGLALPAPVAVTDAAWRNDQ